MDTTKEVAAIKNVLAEYGDAVNASDVSKTLTLFAQDGTLMPKGAPFSKRSGTVKRGI